MHGGAADRSGLIHVGDEVIEVNNINVEGKTPGDVLQILVSDFLLNFGAFWINLDWNNFSKIPREPSRSSWCPRTVSWTSGRARCASRRILTTSRRTIRTSRARRPGLGSSGGTSCTLCHRYVFCISKVENILLKIVLFNYCYLKFELQTKILENE